jgi:oligopeptide transport system substrate-binding protein
MTRWLVVAGVMALGVALLVPISAPGERAEFTFINRGSITTLDPAAMSWMQDIRLALTVWEGLYTYHPETTEPVPGCAYAAEISEDKRTYTFTIRPEARWHNGEPVTSHDFVYAWRRAFEPGTAADYAFFFDLIEGVKAYHAWRTGETERIGGIADRSEKLAARDAHLAEADKRFSEMVEIRALTDKTLRVRLIRPVAYFLDLCAFSIFLPVHPATVEEYKEIGEDGLIYYSEQWVKPENTFFNGAFYLSKWRFKQDMWLAKNPYYWDREHVQLNNIKMIDVEDPNTRWLFYSGGLVDWLSSLDTSYTPDLIGRSNSPVSGAVNHAANAERNDIHAFPAFGTYFYNYNCKDTLPGGEPNPFKDPRVRQAFTMAVNKQTLVDHVVRKNNPIVTTMVPPGSIPGYPKVEGLPYDPERARKLLAEAGYPGGKGIPDVVVLFNTGFMHGDIAQAIVGMWKEELGIQGRVQGKEIKTFREDKKNVNFVVCRASWYGDYGDPTTFLEMFMTGNGNNDSGYSDPKYDQMLVDAEKEIDPGKRLAVLAEAERYLVNEGLPLLPIYQYVNEYAFNPNKVKHLHLTPRMMTVLKAVEVVK